jgi:iron complex outermembrane receptor protein
MVLKSTIRIASLLASSAISAMLLPVSAWAQTSSSSTSSDRDTTLQELVVTAQKRTENLQTTAVTASVFSQTDLDAKHVDNLLQLQQVVPSLSVGEAGITSSVNIRGIGLNVSTPAVVMGVAVYRDGLFQPPILSTEPLFDMAGVEVLRGPQGTFVGSSSTGGAIFYRTRDPELSDLNGHIEAGYGNYKDISANGAVNLPISETLAARIAFNVESRDSFFTQTGDVPNLHGTAGAFAHPGDLAQRNLRLGLKWEPNESLTVLAKVALNNNDTEGLAHVMSTANPFYDGRPLQYKLTYNVSNTKYDERGARGSLQIDYKLQNGIIVRSISGYSDIHTRYVDDFDSSSAPGATGVFNNQVHEYLASQEINLLSPTGERLEWVVGSFYFYNWALPHIAIDQPAPAPTVLLNSPALKQAYAAFGQVSYNLLTNLQLQVGGRYTRSHVRNSGETTLLGLAPFPIVIPQSAKESDGDWTGKISLNWTINPDQYAYAFAAKGYKAGGINGPTSPKFKPETVYDYEAGLKSNFFGGHLRTQINGFYMDYRNLQQNSYIVPVGGLGGANGVTNAGGSKIWGFEAQGQARFGALAFDASLSYVHSKLGETLYIDSNALPGGGNVPLGPQCAAGVASNPPTCFDYRPFTQNLSGRPNPFSPKWTVNAGVAYDFDLGGGATLTPRVDYTYIDSQYQTVQGTPADFIAAHSLVNASLTFAKDAWRVQGYATNIGKKTYISGQTYGPAYFLGRPRQYGVRISCTF